MADTNLEAMSDEEFDNHINSLPDEVEKTEVDDTTKESNPEINNNNNNNNKEAIEDTVKATNSNSSTDTETELDEGETDTADEEEKDLKPASQDSSNEDESKVGDESDTNGENQDTAEEIDYKAFYTKVTSEYKANGKTMPGIKDPEDLVTALQMASNYAQKTAALKPSLKRVKMLKDVTDEELNEMLDFRSRKPEVIKKALKEAELDPLDIDIDEDIDYVPTDHSIPDSQIEFEEVISTIEDTPEFAITSQVVSEQWDEASRQAMLEKPQLIVGLNQEIAMGRFGKVSALMDQARLLGRDQGLNDLQLYQQIVTNLVKEEAQTQSQATQQPQTQTSQTNQVENPARNEKRKQAGVRQKTKADAVKQYDPTTLSDDEFMRLMEAGAKFI